MTDYGNLKIDGRLHEVLKATADEQFNNDRGILTRSAAEGTILWLILYADQDARQTGLSAAGFDSVSDLIRHVRQQQFPRDAEFDPLKPLRGNDAPDTLVPDGGTTDDDGDDDDTRSLKERIQEDMVRGTTDDPVEDVTHCEVCDHYVDGNGQLSHADDCPEGGGQ